MGEINLRKGSKTSYLDMQWNAYITSSNLSPTTPASLNFSSVSGTLKILT